MGPARGITTVQPGSRPPTSPPAAGPDPRSREVSFFGGGRGEAPQVGDANKAARIIEVRHLRLWGNFGPSG